MRCGSRLGSPASQGTGGQERASATGKPSFAAPRERPSTPAPSARNSPQLTFSGFWTLGPGAAPNNAGIFSLVHPLPSTEFIAYGVRHRFRITGLAATELAASAGVENRKLWWNKDTPAGHGFGAVVVPKDSCKYPVDVLGELSVV